MVKPSMSPTKDDDTYDDEEVVEGNENHDTGSSLKERNDGHLTREERRRRRRATAKYKTAHATRERIRVEAFNTAFGKLRELLPTTPPDKKLSKIEILRLSICYIKYLDHVLDMAHNNRPETPTTIPYFK